MLNELGQSKGVSSPINRSQPEDDSDSAKYGRSSHRWSADGVASATLYDDGLFGTDDNFSLGVGLSGPNVTAEDMANVEKALTEETGLPTKVYMQSAGGSSSGSSSSSGGGGYSPSPGQSHSGGSDE